MLIFISDIHLTDGSTTAYPLKAGAFRGTFRDLANHANQAQAKEIKIVFLGDLYDLIRTERWFDFDLKQRPWGEEPSEQVALNILEKIILENKETFDFLSSGRLADQLKFPVEPQLIYVPGNHDRLCNLYPSLRQRVCETLGLTKMNPDKPFEHYILDTDHGVYARHGQEWDPFNFERSEAFRYREYVPVPYEDYMQMPIGDVLAAEVASKLPLVVLEHLPANYPDRDRLHSNLREIFDVRPLGAMIPWLSYQVRRYDKTVQDAINTAVRQVIQDFKQIPFVQRWMDKHDRWRNPFDEADRLQMLFGILEAFEFTSFERVLPLVDKVSQWWHGDNFASKAAEDFRRLDTVSASRDKILYVLYGHTHLPDQQAIEVVGQLPKEERGRMYLNTGTWRPTQQQGITKQGFLAWKRLTYTIIYKPGETVSAGRTLDYPAFESWTGGLKDF